MTWRSPHKAREGRGVGRLLADFGHQVPSVPVAEPEGKAERLFEPVPRRGRCHPDRGWSPAPAPLLQYRMSADQAPVLWPLVVNPSLPARGAQMGIDYFSGASFHADPNGWVLDPSIPVSNPNMITFGKPGMGKSGTVKVFLLRMLGFGYRALILGDVKDEYEPLCRAVGVVPIAIGQGLPARINPLEFGPLRHGWDQLDPDEAKRRAAIVFARWLTLIRGLVGSQKVGQAPVPFGPTEEAVLDAALRMLTGYADGNTQLTETTIPRLWRLLDEPPAELVGSCRYASERHFLDETRLLRDALGQLTSGTLQGLFDDHTNIAMDWSAPMQSLSLSRLVVLGDEAVGMALLCLNSWGRAMRDIAAPGDMRIVVRDESWKQLRLGVDAVKSFDADLRLSRTAGDIQFALAHKPSDLLSVGDAGSQSVAIAKDLLHLADTKILHGQDAAVAEELRTLLGLPDVAVRLVTDWCRQAPGRALWVVGESMFKVQTILHPAERTLTWTNTALEKAG